MPTVYDCGSWVSWTGRHGRHMVYWVQVYMYSEAVTVQDCVTASPPHSVKLDSVIATHISYELSVDIIYTYDTS